MWIHTDSVLVLGRAGLMDRTGKWSGHFCTYIWLSGDVADDSIATREWKQGLLVSMLASCSILFRFHG